MAFVNIHAADARFHSSGESIPKGLFLSTTTQTSTVNVFAQEIYTCFLNTAVNRIQDVGGTTSVRPRGRTVIATTGLESTSDPWEKFNLQNENIESVLNIFRDSGLGTFEEACLHVIPMLHGSGKISFAREVCRKVRSMVKQFEDEGRWEQVREIDIWLHSNLKARNISTHDANAIVSEIGTRLRMLSRQLILQGANSPQTAKPMWKAVKVRSELTSELRWAEDRALGLVTLCMTYRSVMEEGREGESQEELIVLVAETLQYLSNKDQHQSIAMIDAAREAVHGKIFDDPEKITRFLCTLFVQSPQRAVSRLVRRVLLDIRQQSQAFLSNSSFERFLLDPKSPIWATIADRTAPHQGPHPDDDSIPADILLIRGYRTPLQMAAESGNERVVRRLLHARGGINRLAAHQSGRTALQAAAGGGHVDTIAMLLKGGADRLAAPARVNGRTFLQAAAENETDDDHLMARLAADCVTGGGEINASPGPVGGRTALQAAAEYGNSKIVDRLLGLGAEVNAPPARSFGRTALQGAAGRGHSRIVSKLLLVGHADVNGRPAWEGGRTALQAAVEGGHLDVVRFLILHKADVNGPPAPKSGRTALQVAAERGDIDMVEMLLGAGADANGGPAERSGRTALQAAAEGNHHTVVTALLAATANVSAAPSKHEGLTVLQAVLDRKCPRMVELIFGSRFDLEAALHIALANGHTEVVVDLAALENSRWNSRDAEGLTPLGRAVVRKHHRVVKKLLELKLVDSRLRGEDNLALLRGGDEDLLCLLAEANPTAVDDLGNSVLHHAVTGGSWTAVNRLLSDDGHPKIDDVNFRKDTALHIAAAKRILGILELLLTHAHRSPGLKNEELETPLSIAAAGGAEQIVAQLLAKSSEVEIINSKDIFGQTALHLAAKCGSVGIVEQLLLLKGIESMHLDTDRFLPVHRAAANGHAEIVSLLLGTGDSTNIINSQNRSGQTLLHLASHNGHSRVVQLLLEGDGFQSSLPIDLNITDSKKQTALHLAAYKGYAGIVKMLLARVGVNVNIVDLSKQTALHLATYKGYAGMVKMILDRVDVDVNIVDWKKQTALHLAAYKGYAGIVKMIVASNHTDVNRIDSAGKTALHIAVTKGNHDIVELLAHKDKVDINIADANNLTPLQIAAAHRNMRSLKTLLLEQEGFGINEAGREALQSLVRWNQHSRVINAVLSNWGFDYAAEASTCVTTFEPDSRQMATSYGGFGVPARSPILYRTVPRLRSAIANQMRDAIITECRKMEVELFIPNRLTDHGTTQFALKRCNDPSRAKIGLRPRSAATIGVPIDLDLAAGRGIHDRVELLLVGNDVDVNAVDLSNRTPLHMAAMNGHYDVVMLLLGRNDLQVSLQDNDQYTPYMRAIEHGHSKIANALLRRFERDVSDERIRSADRDSHTAILSFDTVGETA